MNECQLCKCTKIIRGERIIQLFKKNGSAHYEQEYTEFCFNCGNLLYGNIKPLKGEEDGYR